VVVVADLAVLVLAESRLYREALCTALEQAADITAYGRTARPTDAFAGSFLRPDVVLVDAAFPDAVAAVRASHRDWPGLRVVVLAGSESEPDLVRLAEAGVNGFVLHDASVQQLAKVIHGVMRGEASCPPRLAAAVLQRLSALAAQVPDQAEETALTARELEIATLVAEGLSNKEIARRLHITLATVKNHVHSILNKLEVTRRADVGQRLRVTGLTLEP
jgi:two-component system, NarL family, nitrate/nitrite response regulator NarL